jgi:AcrR family transcriptional regulator
VTGAHPEGEQLPPIASSARERDTEALVAAATELFAAKGPARTSLREVAARAGVNYGLIHQYIGTKDDLLRLVVRQVSLQTADRVATADSVDALVEDLVRAGLTPYLRMLARELLDGREPAELVRRSPAMAELVERLAVGGPPDTDRTEVAVRAVALMSLVSGWKLFGPFLQSAAGLDTMRADELAARLVDPALRLLQADGPD